MILDKIDPNNMEVLVVGMMDITKIIGDLLQEVTKGIKINRAAIAEEAEAEVDLEVEDEVDSEVVEEAVVVSEGEDEEEGEVEEEDAVEEQEQVK